MRSFYEPIYGKKLAVCPATRKPREFARTPASHFQSREKPGQRMGGLHVFYEVGRFLGFRWNRRSATTCLLHEGGRARRRKLNRRTQESAREQRESGGRPEPCTRTDPRFSVCPSTYTRGAANRHHNSSRDSLWSLGGACCLHLPNGGRFSPSSGLEKRERNNNKKNLVPWLLELIYYPDSLPIRFLPRLLNAQYSFSRRISSWLDVVFSSPFRSSQPWSGVFDTTAILVAF